MGREFLIGAGHDELGQLAAEIVLFDEGQELVGIDRRAIDIAPAHEDLAAADPVGRQRQDGLVGADDVAQFEVAAKAGFEAPVVVQQSVQLGADAEGQQGAEDDADGDGLPIGGSNVGECRGGGDASAPIGQAGDGEIGAIAQRQIASPGAGLFCCGIDPRLPCPMPGASVLAQVHLFEVHPVVDGGHGWRRRHDDADIANEDDASGELGPPDEIERVIVPDRYAVGVVVDVGHTQVIRRKIGIDRALRHASGGVEEFVQTIGQEGDLTQLLVVIGRTGFSSEALDHLDHCGPHILTHARLRLEHAQGFDGHRLVDELTPDHGAGQKHKAQCDSPKTQAQITLVGPIDKNRNKFWHLGPKPSPA